MATTRMFTSGGETLRLVSVLPAGGVGEATATVGIVHGYGDHAGRYGELMAALAGRGLAVHAFDFRGHGRATGRRAYCASWDEYLGDLDAFLAQPEMASGGPRFLYAHSHGGLVAAVAAVRGRLANIRGLVLSAPYFAPAFVVPAWKRALAHVASRVMPTLAVGSGLGDVRMCADEAMLAETAADPLVLRAATARWYLGSSAAQVEAMRDAGRLAMPVLSLIGSFDDIVAPEAVREFHARAGSADKTLIEYPALLHELFRETQRQRVFDDVGAWILARVGGAT